jgi:hypothetical protein
MLLDQRDVAYLGVRLGLFYCLQEIQIKAAVGSPATGEPGI